MGVGYCNCNDKCALKIKVHKDNHGVSIPYLKSGEKLTSCNTISSGLHTASVHYYERPPKVELPLETLLSQTASWLENYLSCLSNFLLKDLQSTMRRLIVANNHMMSLLINVNDMEAIATSTHCKTAHLNPDSIIMRDTPPKTPYSGHANVSMMRCATHSTVDNEQSHLFLTGSEFTLETFIEAGHQLSYTNFSTLATALTTFHSSSYKPESKYMVVASEYEGQLDYVIWLIRCSDSLCHGHSYCIARDDIVTTSYSNFGGTLCIDSITSGRVLSNIYPVGNVIVALYRDKSSNALPGGVGGGESSNY